MGAQAVHPAPLIAYADVPTQYGVVVERRPDGIRISVPHRPWYRRTWAAVVIALVGLQLVGMVAMGVTTGHWLGLITFVVTVAAVGLVVAAARSVYRHAPAAQEPAARFEVNGDTLHVRWQPFGPSGAESKTNSGRPTVEAFSCARHEVVSIRGDLFAMGLTIRVRNRFMAEMLKEQPKVLRVWLAKTLCEALRISHGPSARGE